MIVNKPNKGQVLAYDEDLNQKAINPEELLIKNKELGKIISDLEHKDKEQEKRILSLEKSNKFILEVLLMLIQQANLNLNQQQLMVLKNNGGNENV